MSGQWVQVDKSEKYHLKDAWYTGEDTLKAGYLLCYDQDAGTATSSDYERAWRVEKPSAANVARFAGVVVNGMTGPGTVKLIQPLGNPVADIYADVDATISETFLTLKAGAYVAGKIGEGPVIARACQTVDRDTTNGLILCEFFGTPETGTRAALSASGAGPSPAIWRSCPWAQMVIDPAVGYTFFDDFVGAPTMASATAQGPYLTYQDAGVTVAPLETSDEVGGVIEIANNDADNDEGHIGLGSSATANIMKIASTGGKPCWFEARLKKAGVGNNGVAIFVGVGEEGFIAAEGLVNNTGEVADKDCVGFQVLHADGDSLVPCYRKSGETKQSGTAVAITADTYFKVGFYFDGSTLTGYVDGVSKLSVTDVSAATFPDGEEMTMILLSKVGAAAELAVQMDWWRFAQLR